MIRHRFRRIATLVAATLTFTSISDSTNGRHAEAATATSATAFTAVPPTRVADTRTPFGTTPAGRLAENSTVTVKVVGRPEVAVPATATAVVLQVTETGATFGGYLTVWPTGTARPTVSSVNFTAGAARSNLVTVRLGSGGNVSIFSSAATNIVVDIAGYYTPVSGAVSAGRTVIGGITRAYDSRPTRNPIPTRGWRKISLASYVPTAAQAAILNVTAVGGGGGYLSVVPGNAGGGGTPSTSNLLHSAGETIANQVIVPTPTSDIWIYSQSGGHVIVDVFGYVTGPTAPASTAGLFVPLTTPVRYLDTRSTPNPLGPTMRIWPGWTIEIPIVGLHGIPASGVSGIVGNLTVVRPDGGGYFSSFPAGTGRPNTSSVNAAQGVVVANHQTVSVTSRGVAIYASMGSNALLDIAGYITGTTSVLSGNPIRQSAPTPAFPLTMSIPRTAQTLSVYGDTTDAVIDAGKIGWFPTTAYPGRSGAMVLFGHRTSHGGPFRNLNLMRPGDLITIQGDHRVATYQVYDAQIGDQFTGFRVMTASTLNSQLGTATQMADQLMLVACSKPDGSPTDTAYRIVVYARLVSYTNN